MLCTRVRGFAFFSESSITRVFSKFSPYLSRKYSRRCSGVASRESLGSPLPPPDRDRSERWPWRERPFGAGSWRGAAPFSGFLPRRGRRFRAPFGASADAAARAGAASGAAGAFFSTVAAAAGAAFSALRLPASFLRGNGAERDGASPPAAGLASSLRGGQEEVLPRSPPAFRLSRSAPVAGTSPAVAAVPAARGDRGTGGLDDEGLFCPLGRDLHPDQLDGARLKTSSSHARVMALPDLPARAVLPMRCT